MPPRTRPRRPRRQPREVISLTHTGEGRPNIATAELEPVMSDADRQAVLLAYQRRNQDLDPQLVWRGKDEPDAADLTVAAPPLFIQEKIHPKALVDDLVRLSRQRRQDAGNGNGGDDDDDDDAGARQPPLDLFADFNGLRDPNARTDFYRHQVNWSNRMILGDSLQAMASLAEREGLRGQVQCIYIDPPYGIRFNSNFQWSTTSRDVRDGSAAHITREPEQVKAFRDTWRDGIHSYLSYLRDRLTVARDLLTDSGSVFVQIGDENVHRVRVVMDEVFGEKNFVSEIVFTKTRSLVSSDFVTTICDYILWYAKDRNEAKGSMHKIFLTRQDDHLASHYESADGEILTARERRDNRSDGESVDNYRPFMSDNLIRRPNPEIALDWQGRKITGRFRTNKAGIVRLLKAGRILFTNAGIRYKFFLDDFAVSPLNHLWQDVIGAQNPTYVVQTNEAVIQRCILMTTDPGDLVLDPTCGAGTTAYVAEQWGRRWIAIDTSRVALALARARLMGARYPYYLLADSPEGQRKAAEIGRRPAAAPDDAPAYGDLRQGFVWQRVPHITLRDIANNTEIDAIWDAAEKELAPLRARLSAATGQWSATPPADGAAGRQHPLQEWEVPRAAPADWPAAAADLLAQYWAKRLARQREIDASIAANANFEYLYDRPYTDHRKARVAGPFTVESLSPYRVVAPDDAAAAAAAEPAVAPAVGEAGPGYRYDGDDLPERDFAVMILENLRTSGVQQAHKDDKIDFAALTGWPGTYICAEGRFVEGGGSAADDDADAADAAAAGNGDADDAGPVERRAAIFVGPEFGTVGPADLTAAAREAGAAGFDLLIACAFSYDAHATELNRLGALPILKARMNADLHMADDLKNTGQGNLFVIFGEPDVELQDAGVDQSGAPLWQVKVNGVDIYHPATGQVRSANADGIACWFVDTDYNEASFFVRQAYFLGASSDPYRALKTTLKAEIDAEAWATLRSDTSRPFPQPASGRIAVKVINHLGDEAMKVIAAPGG